MMMAEWTGRQQLMLLLQSVVLGVALGVVFDVFNVADKCARRRRRLVFLCDVLYCLLAALVTFFFSLAVMDGRLHPLLFCGSGVGLVLEHSLFGRYSSRWLYRFGCTLRRAFSVALAVLTRPIYRGFALVYGLCGNICRKISEKPPKKRKKATFFRKKS